VSETPVDHSRFSLDEQHAAFVRTPFSALIRHWVAAC
jgi:hypothetical protein